MRNLRCSSIIRYPLHLCSSKWPRPPTRFLGPFCSGQLKQFQPKPKEKNWWGPIFAKSRKNWKSDFWLKLAILPERELLLWVSALQYGQNWAEIGLFQPKVHDSAEICHVGSFCFRPKSFYYIFGPEFWLKPKLCPFRLTTTILHAWRFWGVFVLARWWWWFACRHLVTAMGNIHTPSF